VPTIAPTFQRRCIDVASSMPIADVGRGTVAAVTPRSRLASAAAIGYLVGTFPTADLVARRASRGRIDLRQTGSRNPGSANALNMLGARAGALVLVGDIGKGAAACAIGGLVAGPVGAHLAGTSSVVGHCYPIWNGFRGGKGVAASVGQCLATFPAYFPIDVAVAVATAAKPRLKQRAFVATVASSACWVLGGVVWWARGLRNLWGPKPTAMLPIASAVSSAVIIRRFLAASPPAAGIATP
jgi:glycerol-3-phosphate acyltransferase PlsY